MANLETVVVQLDERARQLISWAALAELKGGGAKRPSIRGAGLSPDGRLYVTDGHRMHIVRLLLRGLLSQTIHLGHEDLRMLATTSYSEITVCSDGQDPINYVCVIPKEPASHSLTFRSARKLRAALNGMKCQIREAWGFRSAGVALFSISPSSGGIALHREGGMGRGGKEKPPVAQFIEGVGAEDAPLLEFDLRYLHEAIQLVDGEVRLAFNGPLDPGVIGDLTTGDYLALVMPKRIKNEEAIRTAWYELRGEEQRRKTA